MKRVRPVARMERERNPGCLMCRASYPGLRCASPGATNFVARAPRNDGMDHIVVAASPHPSASFGRKFSTSRSSTRAGVGDLDVVVRMMAEPPPCASLDVGVLRRGEAAPRKRDEHGR